LRHNAIASRLLKSSALVLEEENRHTLDALVGDDGVSRLLDPGQPECVDFRMAEDETPLHHGDYIQDEWKEAYGMTIETSTTEGDGKARIYDTIEDTGADPCLGSPNERCTPPGPGVGEGGEPDIQDGANCEPQGNVFIIQDLGRKEPDSTELGGTISFSFDPPLEELISIGFMNIGADTAASLKIFHTKGDSLNVPISGNGANSIQDVVLVDAKSVLNATFSATGPFAIRKICFIPSPPPTILDLPKVSALDPTAQPVYSPR